jgi:hypothetical protein
VLLRALEHPVNRGVWETLWAAVLRCEEEMAYGRWGSAEPEWLGEFKDAARKIAWDETVPLVWRGRFAVRVLMSNIIILISHVAHAGGAREGEVMSVSCVLKSERPVRQVGHPIKYVLFFFPSQYHRSWREYTLLARDRGEYLRGTSTKIVVASVYD